VKPEASGKEIESLANKGSRRTDHKLGGDKSPVSTCAFEYIFCLGSTPNRQSETLVGDDPDQSMLEFLVVLF
jgi:hypothetical protein